MCIFNTTETGPEQHYTLCTLSAQMEQAQLKQSDEVNDASNRSEMHQTM